MDEDNQLPEEEQPVPDPQEFRETLEEGAQEDQQEMSESPGVELPEAVGEMESMGSDAAAEEDLDQPPPEIPEQAQEPAIPSDDGPEPPPLADLAEMGTAAAEEAQVGAATGPLPVVEEMEAMGADADAEVPPARTQEQQVRQSIPRQRRHQFEMEVGSFEADMSGMDYVSAESAYRETNYAWQRLLTQMVIDHQHRLEQLLSMLERER